MLHLIIYLMFMTRALLLLLRFTTHYEICTSSPNPQRTINIFLKVIDIVSLRIFYHFLERSFTRYDIWKNLTIWIYILTGDILKS